MCGGDRTTIRSMYDEAHPVTAGGPDWRGACEMRLCTEVTGRNVVHVEKKVSMYSVIRVIGCVLLAAAAALWLLQRLVLHFEGNYIRADVVRCDGGEIR